MIELDEYIYQNENIKALYSEGSFGQLIDLPAGHISELMDEGKIKFVEVDEYKRIPHSELVRIYNHGL